MADLNITSTGSSSAAGIVGGRTTSSIGGYETSAQSLPFIREQDIGILATGLKPSTQLYVFFDNKLVSALVTPATLDFTIQNPAISDFNLKGIRGASLYSDGVGRVAGLLHIPAGTFFTGDRLVVITDVNNLNNISSATTVATFTFHAFNYSITNVVDSAVVSTRPTSTSVSSTYNSSSEQTTVVQVVTNSDTVINNYPPPVVTPPVTFTPPVAPTPWRWPFVDPIAQSFYLGSDGLNGSDGVYATSVDLYFQTKDPDLGVTVDLRVMENGIPTSKVLPFSKVYVPSASVNVSTTSATATRVTFPSPVFLASDFGYVVTITPDGNNPNYRMYTAVVGQSDLLTNTPITKNWGSGDLFTSTNSKTWVPIQNEFLKFTLNIANFGVANGTVALVNKDYEFIIPNSSNTSGFFEQGEYVFKSSANLFSNSSISGAVVSVNTSSYTVTLGGSNTTPGFSAFSNTTPLIASNGSAYDVLWISSVANSTSMTLKNLPKFTTANASLQYTPIGKVYTYDPKQFDLTLEESTASNSSFLFANNDTLIGVRSGANTQVLRLRDRIVNRFDPYFYTTSLPGTGLSLSMKNITSSYSNTAAYAYDLTHTSYIVDKEIIVASKTNEILNTGGRKSFTANVSLSSINNLISPSLDLQSASVIGYRNVIDNSALNENTKTGTARNKYISPTITLTPGIDSEDLNVYITAYKPANTYIQVYAKVLSANDPELFDTKDWTLLDQLTNSALYSDPVNLSDVKEYTFSIPNSPPSVAKAGVLTTSTGSATISGIGTSFTTDIAPNDLVKIYSDSTKTTFQIAKVISIASATSITIDNNAAFNSSTAIYERITTPKTAFNNTLNNYVTRYYSSSGVAYDGFLTYALKVVLLSDVSYLAPRLQNIRAVALV